MRRLVVGEVVVAASALLVAVVFRIQQLPIQVLLDDEWHAVHQLLNSSPGETFLSFGASDHSIPLTLFFYLLSQLSALNESLMRMPSVIFGLSFCGLIYAHSRRQFGVGTALPVLWLAALSTILIYYSRLARPYVISLTLCYSSLYLFERLYQSESPSSKPIMLVLYAVVTTVGVWLHPLIGLSVSSPYLYYLIGMLVRGDPAWRAKVRKLVVIAMPATILGCALVLPPMASDFGALAGKMGSNFPDADTLVSAAHWWYGVQSSWVLWMAAGLTSVGIISAFKGDPLVRHAIIGTALIALALYGAEPRWVHHGSTYARYLIIVVPILIIAMVRGIIVLNRYLVEPGWRAPTVALASVAWIVICFIDSPVRDDWRRPDNYVLHPINYHDLRASSRTMERYFGKFDVSSFWGQLVDYDQERRVGVAPYYFRSDKWPSPLWQRRANAQVLPVALGGFCLERRKGEVPWTSNFHLRNAVDMSHLGDLKRKKLDYIVLNKPQQFNYKNSVRRVGMDIGECREVFATRFGPPVYEDSLLIAYKPE